MQSAVTRLQMPAARAAQEDLSAMDRHVGARWFTPWRLAFGGGALVLLIAVGVLYVRYALTRTLATETDHIVISTVHNGTFSDHIPATGTIVSKYIAYIDAVEGGQISELLVEEGAHVVAGQPIVRLRNTNLRLDVLAREAQLMEQLDRLNSAMLTFQQTRLQHEREIIDSRAQIDAQKRLRARRMALQVTGAVAESDIIEGDAALVRLQETHAAVQEAADADRAFQLTQIPQLRSAIGTTTKNLAMVGESLESLTIRAPFDGQLTTLDAHIGESKAPGQRIGQVDQTGAYEVEALLDEFYLERVAIGQEATAEIAGRERHLRVSKVYPQVHERQFKVDLQFTDDTAAALRRGQTLQLRVQLGLSKEGLVVANGAFFDATAGRWVFVLDSSGSEAGRRNVHLGRRNTDEVEVLDGLTAGERVITSGYESYLDFDRIQLRHTAP